MHRMTCVKRRSVEGETNPVYAAVDSFVLELPVDSDIQRYYVRDEAPAWEEGEIPHAEEDIYLTNLRATSVTDALIVHGFDDGSCALGHFETCALHAPQKMPVLVIVGEDATMSKAWSGQRWKYSNLTIERVPGYGHDYYISMNVVVSNWLTRNRERILNGPTTRAAFEQGISPMSKAVARAWGRASERKRHEISTFVQLSEEAIALSLDDPLLYLALPTGDTMHIVDALLEERQAVERAQSVFDLGELAAWQKWAEDKNSDFAVHVLDVANIRINAAGIARTKYNLRQADGWARFVDEWMRKQ